MKQTTVRSDAHADARRLASRVLLELDLCGIVPSPRMFELFHMHLGGGKPELTRNLRALLDRSSPPKPGALDALYAEHLGRDVDDTQESADALRQEAQGIIEDVSVGGENLQRYGQVLSEWSAGLKGDRSVESLSQAVETLTTETARASERNRVLEQQLASATARVARLRDSLVDVKREATTDALTGLCNRKAFDKRLRRSLSALKSDGTPMSVLMLDVDHFKKVNDTYGHQVGDLVLRLIGRLDREREGPRYGSTLWRRGVRDHLGRRGPPSGADRGRADPGDARKQAVRRQGRAGAGVGDDFDRCCRSSAVRYRCFLIEPRRRGSLSRQGDGSEPGVRRHLRRGLRRGGRASLGRHPRPADGAPRTARIA